MKPRRLFVPALCALGLALPCASLVADVLAAELYAAPPAWSSPAPAPAPPPSLPSLEGAARELASRRIFVLDDPSTAVAVVAPAPIPELPDGEQTTLPITLTGTLVATGLGADMATLRVAGEPQIAVVGSAILEAEVVAITRGAVILREGDRLTTVPFDRRAPTTTSTPPPRPTPSSEVTETGSGAYTVPRRLIDEALAAPPAARVVPNWEGDTYAGFKLIGVRPGSLFRQLGIRSGDVVRAVNGQAIDSPSKGLSLFEALKGETSVEVELERRGTRKVMRYTIQ